jgi:hypothetical protein
LKVTYYLLGFMICLNAMTILLQGLGVDPVTMTPYNSTVLADTYNATEIVESWNPIQRAYYDIGSGLRYIWNINVPLIESALGLATALGAPDAFISIIRIPWRFTWVGFVISFLSGRDFMP